jgi:hypothetical protein
MEMTFAIANSSSSGEVPAYNHAAKLALPNILPRFHPLDYQIFSRHDQRPSSVSLLNRLRANELSSTEHRSCGGTGMRAVSSCLQRYTL